MRGSCKTVPKSRRSSEIAGLTSAPTRTMSRQPAARGKPAETAELADGDPVVRIGGDRRGLGKAAQRKQHDAAPAAHNRPRRRRTAPCRRRRRCRAAARVQRIGSATVMPTSSAIALLRRIAVESGRVPARMNASTASISGSPAQALAPTCARRSRNTPPPKNSSRKAWRRRWISALAKPRRRRPTMLRPTRFASGPCAKPHGMTSARMPLRPTIIAPSPMRTNWRTAAWPPRKV